MHKNPNRLSEQKSIHKPFSKPRNALTAQHVFTRSSNQLPLFRTGSLGSDSAFTSLLHALPFETLANVTASLEPPSLLALGLVDKYLKTYIDNDAVWKIAFLAHFLGVTPEGEAKNARVLFLRRIESSWKREYIARYNLVQRWNRSKTATLTHIPLQLPVSTMHLLNDRQSLICFSADFGIAVRTLPATGKVLKGRLLPFNADPTGPLWPRPSLCALASEGGTAKFAWGTQSGESLYTVVPKVMEVSNRRNGHSVRCNALDQHVGSVNHVSWAMTKATEYEYFVTAGSDGRVKIWNVFGYAMVWQSIPRTTPCILAAFDLQAGVVVAVYKNGDVTLYSDVQLDPAPIDAHETMVFHTPDIDHTAQIPNLPDRLILDTKDLTSPTVLLHINGDSHAWRIKFDITLLSVTAARLNGPVAPLTSIETDFSNTSHSLVYGGDTLGHVYIWPWSTAGEHDAAEGDYPHILPSLSWDTEDGLSISVIRTNGVVVLTGNSRGSIKVWDVLTLRLLRTFKTPQPKPTGQQAWAAVNNLILDSDQIIASVGRYVMYWKAGAVLQPQPWKKAKKVTSQSNIPKWRDFTEMQRAIKESQEELEATARAIPRVSTTAQEQMEALQTLGLEEAEAVAYALMLSHEEALKTEREALTAVCVEEPGEEQLSQRSLTPTSVSPPAISPSTSLRASPPFHAVGKIQLARLEPMSVGGLGTPSPTKMTGGLDEFPSISTSVSPTLSTPVGEKAGSEQNEFASGKVTPPTPPTTSWSAVVKSAKHGTDGGEKKSAVMQRRRPPIDDEDAQLQFVLEISLAEALSEGSRSG